MKTGGDSGDDKGSSSGLLASSSHYDVLEVPTTATFETIKSSYQNKARKLHPDKRRSRPATSDEEEAAAEALFLRLQNAWECLRNVESRNEYDTNLALKKGKDDNKYSKSQELGVEELELVEEEDTGDLCYVYGCRCGEEIWFDQNKLQGTSNNNNNDANNGNNNNQSDNIYMNCDGCSLTFHVKRQSFIVQR